MSLSAVSALAMGAIDPSSQQGLVVAAACAFSACSNAGWNALDVLSTEAFAAEVRATAFAALAASGRVASILAQVVNGTLSHDAPTLLAVTSVFMALGCVGVMCVRLSVGGRGLEDDHVRLREAA